MHFYSSGILRLRYKACAADITVKGRCTLIAFLRRVQKGFKAPGRLNAVRALPRPPTPLGCRRFIFKQRRQFVQGFLFRTQPELSGEANRIFMNLLLTCFNQMDSRRL